GPEVPQGLLRDLKDVGARRQAPAPRAAPGRGARQAARQSFGPARVLEIEESERSLDQPGPLPGHRDRLEILSEGGQAGNPLLPVGQRGALPESVRARRTEALIEGHPLLLEPWTAPGGAGIASGQVRVHPEDECGRQDHGGVGCERQYSQSNEPAHQTLQKNTPTPSSRSGLEGLRSGVTT